MGLVHITQSQGRIPVIVFHIQDRISLENFAEIEDAAREAYRGGMRDAVIDLSRVAALTSIGVRAIIVVHRLLAIDAGRHLKVAGATPEIRDMLDISGVTQYVGLYDSVEDAVASF